MKKRLSILMLVLMALTGCNTVNHSTTSNISSEVEEGNLYIPSVELYMNMDPQRVDVYFDKTLTLEYDLYFDVIDETICQIKDGFAYPIGIGDTVCYASTINGQEVEFKIHVYDELTQTFDKILRSHEDKINNDESYKKENATMFVGDSYFDVLNFWKTFNYDWSDYNCKSLGMSGSKCSDWMYFKQRLFKNIHPKNIVIHLGTNDINDVAVLKTVDGYYDVITRFLNEFCNENSYANIYFISIEDRTFGSAGRNFYSSAVTQKIKDEFVETVDNLTYIDTATYINAHANELFLEDGVHLNSKGYEYYVSVLKEKVDFE